MKALTSLKTAQLDKMKILFRNAHAIAKKGREFQDYEWQCKLVFFFVFFVYEMLNCRLIAEYGQKNIVPM